MSELKIHQSQAPETLEELMAQIEHLGVSETSASAGFKTYTFSLDPLTKTLIERLSFLPTEFRSTQSLVLKAAIFELSRKEPQEIKDILLSYHKALI